MEEREASPLVPWGDLSSRILEIRGRRVILGADLALLYGVLPRRFHEQVRRNQGRFPTDFAFRLTREEVLEVAANCVHLHNLRYSRKLPLAFTEHGAIMAASVLRSPRAVAMSILVVRAFVRMRAALAAHGALAARLAGVERRVGDHDEVLAELIEAIRRLLEPVPEPDWDRIGFHGKMEEGAP